MAVGDVLAGAGCAVCHRVAAQGAGTAEDARRRLDKVKYKYSRTNDVFIN